MSKEKQSTQQQSGANSNNSVDSNDQIFSQEVKKKKQRAQGLYDTLAGIISAYRESQASDNVVEEQDSLPVTSNLPTLK